MSKRYRKNPRLKNYNYSLGLFSVTICTYGRECLFGDIINGDMVLNEIGEIAEYEWKKTEIIRNNVLVDVFQIMPNHIHGIIGLSKPIGAYCNTPLWNSNVKLKSPSNNLGAVIRGFKSTSAKQINVYRGTFYHKVWQRNYYEHIIRNERDLVRVRNYIENNPGKWENDKFF